jgi:hypothetical protein
LYRIRIEAPDPSQDKKSDFTWDETDMAEAVKLKLANFDTMSYANICGQFNNRIPETTLKDRVKAAQQNRLVKSVGRPTTLPAEHERWLACWIFFCYRLGVPPRKIRIFRKAKEVGDKAGIKFNGKHGLPSNSWWRGFKKRHKIKLGRSTHRSRAAAHSLTRESLNSFYDLLFDLVSHYNIPPELIFATDETGFMRTTGKGWVAMPEGGAVPKLVGDELSIHITLQGIVNAVGDALPLLLILKGQGMRLKSDPLEGLPEDCAVLYTRKSLLSSCLNLLIICSQSVDKRAGFLPFRPLVRLDDRLSLPQVP